MEQKIIKHSPSSIVNLVAQLTNLSNGHNDILTLLGTTELIKRDGYNDLVSVSGAGTKGNAAPTPILHGNHMYERWDIGDYKTFTVHILHDMKYQTLIYPHVHWRTLTANPDTSKVVQWDLIWSKGKSYAQAPYTEDVIFSLVDSPTGYNYNEIIEASSNQAFVADVDDLITLTVKRVTPSSGNSYTGVVVLDMMDLHYFSDMILTNEKNSPFTKSNV